MEAKAQRKETDETETKVCFEISRRVGEEQGQQSEDM